MARRYRKKNEGSWIGIMIVLAVIVYIIKILFPLLIIAGIVAAGYGIYCYGNKKARGGIVLSSLALVLCVSLGGYVYGHSNGNVATQQEKPTTSNKLTQIATSSSTSPSTSSVETSTSTTQITSTTTSTTTESAEQSDPEQFLLRKPANQKIPATVNKFVDGDTTYFLLGSQMIKVRYLLIDTPETKSHQPYADQAKERVRQLLTQAKTIELAYDIGQKQDHYGRELMYVFADGQLVQEILAREGLAMVHYITPPNTQYLNQVQAAQEQAKAENLNIWSVAGYADAQGYHEDASVQNQATTPVQATPAQSQPAPATNGETQYVDANGNGLIKGSANGIYHIPGSRYYNRTTNPVQMFKTISEAEQAGFRAPRG